MNSTRKRQRRQAGWLELDKSTSPHCWKARYNDWAQVRIDKSGRRRAVQKSVVLGYKVKDELPTKSAAAKKWEQIRSTLVEPEPGCTPTACCFKAFVENTFVPNRTAVRRWRPRTKEKFDHLMSKLYPKFGHRLLTESGTAELQRFLNDLAQDRCHHTVAGMLTCLRAIFSCAVDLEYIDKNPSRKLVLTATREPVRLHVKADQVRLLETSLVGRDQVSLRLFSRCGLRAGEVFGLQWGDILPEQAILISRTFSKGKIGPPKTKGSAKAVAIPKSLFQDLMCLREEQGNWKPEDWVFPASRVRGEKRMPLSAENWLKRTIKPLAEQLGFTINLHMFRRGFATIAHQSGGSLKDIQEQLRHASVTTTANIYVQAVPESVRAVVEKIDHTLRNMADGNRQVA